MEGLKMLNFVFTDSSTMEYIMLEIQGNIQHTVEKKYYFMFMGHLSTLDKVRLWYLFRKTTLLI